MVTVLTVELALRDWDWLTPLRLGEVCTDELAAAGVALHVTPVPSLVDDWQARGYAAAEVSLSKTARTFAQGGLAYGATPVAMMQGFRQRCVIVNAESEYERASDLVGKRIGVTGWPDSGNTWTRQALADDGLGIEDAYWYVGRLTQQHPESDRLSGFGRQGRIEAIFGKPMADRLADGELDAVLTPFMPPGFYAQGSPWRRLYPDVRRQELDWARANGYVPAHHVLAFDREVPAPVRRVVIAALEASRAAWRVKREKYTETSAWLAVDFGDEAGLPSGWNVTGSASQQAMFAGFFAALKAQDLVSPDADFSHLFSETES